MSNHVFPPGPPRRVVYDVARAGAAIAVLLAHARSLTMLDAGEQPALSLLGRLFYGISGLGHQAVIVFFVLSGALVTRSMLALDQAGLWSWQAFVTARLTRLWVVLIPCLALGGLLDATGLVLLNPVAGGRLYGALGPTTPALALDPATFLGNLVFLQTVVVAPFGTNGPLWSLAYEAWYYLLAGLLWSGWRAWDRPRIVAPLAVVAALVCVRMTADMAVLAPTWLSGALLAFAPPPPSRWTRPAFRYGSLALLIAAMGAARTAAVDHRIIGDDAVALATVSVLWIYEEWVPDPSSFLKVVGHLARQSYSLYLSHLPLLAFLAALVLGNRREALGPSSLARLCAGSAAALLYASALWWGFERRTEALRRFLHRGREPEGAQDAAPVATFRRGTA